MDKFGEESWSTETELEKLEIEWILKKIVEVE
jgi:hypothetical protein